MKQFLRFLYYQFLMLVLPKWLKSELSMSLQCNNCVERCSCVDVYERNKLAAQMATKHQSAMAELHKTISEQGQHIIEQSNAIHNWRKAWSIQREDISKEYWKGFSDGKMVAVEWHEKLAKHYRTAMRSLSYDHCRKEVELDAKMHEWCKSQIMLAGMDVEKSKENN